MSQLQGILTRLKSLQEQAKESESAQRFFENRWCEKVPGYIFQQNRNVRA